MKYLILILFLFPQKEQTKAEKISQVLSILEEIEQDINTIDSLYQFRDTCKVHKICPE